MKHPRIADSEWPLLEILWQGERSMSLGEIVEQLGQTGAPPNPRTVATYLNRLTTKSAVEVQKAGRNNLYRAAIAREDCVQQETTKFLRRVFRGATAPAILHLVKEHDLNEDEIAELRKILDR